MNKTQKKESKSVVPYKRLINIQKITHDEWLEWRKKGIGGSDAGKILGVSHYGTQFSVYNDKLGLSEPIPQNEAMIEGHYFEDGVARRLQDNHPELKVRVNPYMMQSKKYPYMIADIDREAVKEDGTVIGIEIKNPSMRNKTKFEEGEVVEDWFYQVLHYMVVTGYREYILAICHLSLGYYEFHFHLDKHTEWEFCRNEEFIKQFDVQVIQEDLDELARLEGEFWHNHVEKRELPTPDGTASYTKAYVACHLLSDGSLINIDHLSEACANYLRLNGEIKALEEEKEIYKQKLILGMGEASRGESDFFKISYNTSAPRESVDTAKLKKEYYDIWRECLKIGSPTRTLRVSSIELGEENVSTRKIK